MNAKKADEYIAWNINVSLLGSASFSAEMPESKDNILFLSDTFYWKLVSNWAVKKNLPQTLSDNDHHDWGQTILVK